MSGLARNIGTNDVPQGNGRPEELAQNTSALGPMPVSFQGLFYQAMSQLTAFDIAQMQKYLDYLKTTAENMGGLDDDGHAILNSNGGVSGGLMGKQLSLSFDCAEKQGDSTRDEAKGYMGSSRRQIHLHYYSKSRVH